MSCSNPFLVAAIGDIHQAVVEEMHAASAAPEAVSPDEEPTVKLPPEAKPYRSQAVLVSIGKDVRSAERHRRSGNLAAAVADLRMAYFARGVIAVDHGGRPSSARMDKALRRVELAVEDEIRKMRVELLRVGDLVRALKHNQGTGGER